MFTLGLWPETHMTSGHTRAHTHRYVEIVFSPEGRLRGAAVRTYLLERSRVVHVAPQERSDHAFYQVCGFGNALEWWYEQLK